MQRGCSADAVRMTMVMTAVVPKRANLRDAGRAAERQRGREAERQCVWRAVWRAVWRRPHGRAWHCPGSRSSTHQSLRSLRSLRRLRPTLSRSMTASSITLEVRVRVSSINSSPVSSLFTPPCRWSMEWPKERCGRGESEERR